MTIIITVVIVSQLFRFGECLKKKKPLPLARRKGLLPLAGDAWKAPGDAAPYGRESGTEVSIRGQQRTDAQRECVQQRGRREEISPEPLPLACDEISSSSKTEEVELGWSC